MQIIYTCRITLLSYSFHIIFTLFSHFGAQDPRLRGEAANFRWGGMAERAKPSTQACNSGDVHSARRHRPLGLHNTRMISLTVSHKYEDWGSGLGPETPNVKIL